MTAGFPTDDPWGDRQQGLDLASFAELLRGRPFLQFAWTPGAVRFEYSNLGYGILGRVITNVGGQEYREVVTALGCSARACHDVHDVPRGRCPALAWHAATPVAPKTTASSATSRSTATAPSRRWAACSAASTTLARWVAEFVDAFPPRATTPGSAPARAGEPARDAAAATALRGRAISAPSTDAPPEFQGGAYGFGLTTLDHLSYGRIVMHSGGYPGFGSNMRWHPASGTRGRRARENGRYAPAHPPVGGHVSRRCSHADDKPAD